MFLVVIAALRCSYSYIGSNVNEMLKIKANYSGLTETVLLTRMFWPDLSQDTLPCASRCNVKQGAELPRCCFFELVKIVTVTQLHMSRSSCPCFLSRHHAKGPKARTN